jgi:hypothetical protein
VKGQLKEDSSTLFADVELLAALIDAITCKLYLMDKIFQ